MKLIKTDRIKTPLTAEEIEEAKEIFGSRRYADYGSSSKRQDRTICTVFCNQTGFRRTDICENSKEKFYILLCTCAVTRALHLE
ncbi:hypothetical protein TNCV_1423171 [Trichonephila clavipes]|nr:hypothetical protein TNCV_1423171 [Trichonephila clavipes]